MTNRKTVQLKPIRKGRNDPERFARRAREINDCFREQGRHFPDSTEIIRADRDSRS